MLINIRLQDEMSGIESNEDNRTLSAEIGSRPLNLNQTNRVLTEINNVLLEVSKNSHRGGECYTDFEIE
eukprot:snap_masked-scaffold_6-processed-gene-15.30-mRNA-1 protein AED:1.00 eAED:1.00 QI:0/-1/0/0/-1/1/1/0/68